MSNEQVRDILAAALSGKPTAQAAIFIPAGMETVPSETPKTAAATYHAGEQITNERDGITHDYTRKGGVVHTEILLPDNAPAEYADHTTL